tara:strand:+ start:99 stop:989 length:891 start_codon:yes stop_codon:yes gene_type:complete
MSQNLSLINGEFKDSISVYDRGLAYGDGFFETMLWDSFVEKNETNVGVEFWLRHLRRIKDGCQLMQINLPFDEEIIRQRNLILKASLKEKKSGLLKMIVTRGVGGRGYKFERNMIPTIIFLSLPKPKVKKEYFKQGVVVKICKTQLSKNTNLFGYKHLNRLDSVLARSEWEDKNIFEGIFVDSKRNILEGTMTNIFFVHEKTLITPPIIDSGINGVMRQVIIDKAKFFFDKLVIQKINLRDVEKFDQMFLTNSVLKVIPVIRFEKKKFIKKKNVIDLINFFNCKNDREKLDRLNLI